MEQQQEIGPIEETGVPSQIQQNIQSIIAQITPIVDKYATPFNVTCAVSAIILMSVILFIVDQVQSKSNNSTRGKYARYADENNDDPKDKDFVPDSESDSDEEPEGVRRSTRLRAKRKAAKKAKRATKAKKATKRRKKKE